MKRKVLIIGATGSLAKVVIDNLQTNEDVELTLFARNTARIGNPGNAKLIDGDALNYTDVKNAVKGQDFVYINLAGRLKEMAENIVGAMLETGVSRVLAISSIGIYETPLKPILKSYRELADVVEASGLTYTILRPDWFTSGSEIDYVLTHKGEPEIGKAVSRKSIASFIISIIENPSTHTNENLGISRPN